MYSSKKPESILRSYENGINVNFITRKVKMARDIDLKKMMLFFLTKRCFWNITACWSFLDIYTCTYKALRVEDIYVYINTLFYREVAQRVEPGKRPGNLAVVRTNTGIIRHNRKTIQLFSLNLFLLYKTLSMLLSRDQLCYNTIFVQVLLCLLYKLFRKCLPIFFGKPAIVYFILGIKKKPWLADMSA